MPAPDRARGSVPMHRRTFLKTAGVAGAAAGLEGILGARRAPAFAQGTTIHLLHWVDFIPEGDVELRRQIAEYQKQTKVEVVFETINANDLQPRITAAIQSGSGPDIIMMLHNWPHLYAGGWPTSATSPSGRPRTRAATTHSEAAAKVGKGWLGLPYATWATLIAYRKSWFAEAGATQPPKTLEEYKKLGAALKKKGKPLGQTLGHTFGDAPAWTYPLLWTFGGAETDQSGKKVVLNSQGHLEAVKWMTAFWKDALRRGRAGLGRHQQQPRLPRRRDLAPRSTAPRSTSCAKRNPDKIKDDKGEPMWHDIGHFAIPDGPGGTRRPTRSPSRTRS